jgi:hypothetical protein
VYIHKYFHCIICGKNRAFSPQKQIFDLKTVKSFTLQLNFVIFTRSFRTRRTVKFCVELSVVDGVVFNDSTVIPTRSDGYNFFSGNAPILFVTVGVSETTKPRLQIETEAF